MTLRIGLNSSPPQLGAVHGCGISLDPRCNVLRVCEMSPALCLVRLHSPLSYSFPACPVEELGVRASNFRKAHQASKALGRTYTSKIPGTVRNGGP